MIQLTSIFVFPHLTQEASESILGGGLMVSRVNDAKRKQIRQCSKLYANEVVMSQNIIVYIQNISINRIW